MNKRWANYAVVVGAALFTGSVLTLELYFSARATMQQVDLVDIAIPQFGRTALWAALAPLILKMREKMPLQRGGWLGGVSFHFIASFVIMATYYLGRLWSYSIFFHEQSFHEGSFWRTAAVSFHGHNIIDMAYYWGVIAFGYSFEIYHKYKSEELKAAQLETRLIETELKALRQQMHPHFLFNTMNTISVLVRERRHDEAVSLIARLSSLLRMSLDNTGVPEVTLQQELVFLGHYIEIQKARFSDRLTVEIDIAPEALRARIPNLLLQPIVENAIIHGVALKSEPGHVQIFGRIEGDRLHLEVRDDGPGITNGHQRAKEGVGLANTRERLTKIYGVRTHLALHSQPGRGVSVQIILPYRT
jgi:two-component system LytT family sensor kinase